MAIDVNPNQRTRALLEQILIAFRDGERVRMLVRTTDDANKLISRLRVAKFRALRDVRMSGRRIQHFNLSATYHPYTSVDRTRMVAVYFWKEVTLGQESAQEMERLLES